MTDTQTSTRVHDVSNNLCFKGQFLLISLVCYLSHLSAVLVPCTRGLVFVTGEGDEDRCPHSRSLQ